MKNKFLFLLFLIMLATTSFADAPPDPGYTYTTVELRVRILADIPEYRFFLESPVDVQEFAFSNGEAEISGDGRGGPTNLVTLISIPKKELAETMKMPELKDSLRDKKIPGVIELARHNFRAEVPERFKNMTRSTIYVFERDKEKGVKLAGVGGGGGMGGESKDPVPPISNEPPPGFKVFDIPVESENKGMPFVFIVAGVLLTLAAFALGIWVIRKLI